MNVDPNVRYPCTSQLKIIMETHAVYIFYCLNVVNYTANIPSLVVVVSMHTCMHTEVCSVLVTASCV